MTRDEVDAFPLMLRVPDVMALTGCGRSAVYEMIRTGTIPSVRLSSRCIRVPKHRLLQVLGLSDNGLETAEAPAAALSVTTDASTHGPIAGSGKPTIERPV